jgi:NDP-sugar pyrophosphorylase family protein
MLLSWRDDRDAFGGVTLDDERRVTAFKEKQEGIGPGYVNAGVYIFERATLAEIPQNRVVSLERDVLPKMIGRGLCGWVDEAAFIDIGTPDSYRRAHSFLREDAA